MSREEQNLSGREKTNTTKDSATKTKASTNKAPDEKGALKSNQQNLPLVLPEKVTMMWLFHHVPVTFWLWLAGFVIGVFIVGVTVGQTTFVKELFNKKIEAPTQPQISSSEEIKSDQKNIDSKKDEPNADPLKMSEPTPMQIIEAIDKAPPLQREDMARRYEGIKVDWELIFSSASQYKNDFVLLLFDTSYSNLSPAIRCAVRLSDYKELGIMKPGKKMRVVGTVSYANSLFVDLKDVQLTY